MFKLILIKIGVVISYIYHLFVDEPENNDADSGDEEA